MRIGNYSLLFFISFSSITFIYFNFKVKSSNNGSATPIPISIILSIIIIIIIIIIILRRIMMNIATCKPIIKTIIIITIIIMKIIIMELRKRREEGKWSCRRVIDITRGYYTKSCQKDFLIFSFALLPLPLTNA